MLARDRRSRPRRPDRRRRVGQGAEGLEARRLLVATPINVASGVVFAIASPLPGLASGAGMGANVQALSGVTATVAPAPTGSPFGPSATGPSTTLSPLPNDSETAVAAASEVARPMPGRSDRIASVIVTPEIVPLPHVNLPEPVEVIPGPEVQVKPPAPAPVPADPGPVVPPPAEPARPVEPEPAPKVAPEPPQPPMALEAWDVALGIVATEEPGDAPDSPATHATEVLAAGALLAAWGGWKFGPNRQGRARRRPIAIDAAR